LTRKRTAASPTIATMYGQSGRECETIAWSTARCVSTGIAIEISVYAKASESPRAPRRHSARQSRSSLRKVGSRPRSGGSTGFGRSGMAEEPTSRLLRTGRAVSRP
jgi:hypothetical protein